MKTLSNYDKQVQIRNGIVMILQEGIKQGNQGSSAFFKKALNRISNLQGYSVVIGEQRNFKIDGVQYTKEDKVVQIKEDGNILCLAYKDKRDGMVVLHVDSYDLMTQKELKEAVDMDLDRQLSEILNVNKKQRKSAI